MSRMVKVDDIESITIGLDEWLAFLHRLGESVFALELILRLAKNASLSDLESFDLLLEPVAVKLRAAHETADRFKILPVTAAA